MVFGSLVVGACLITLGWTSEIVGLFVKDPNKVLFCPSLGFAGVGGLCCSGSLANSLSFYLVD